MIMDRNFQVSEVCPACDEINLYVEIPRGPISMAGSQVLLEMGRIEKPTGLRLGVPEMLVIDQGNVSCFLPKRIRGTQVD